jgi:hypothetical protein
MSQTGLPLGLPRSGLESTSARAGMECPGGIFYDDRDTTWRLLVLAANAGWFDWLFAAHMQRILMPLAGTSTPRQGGYRT